MLGACARIQPPPGLAPDAEAPRVVLHSPRPGSLQQEGELSFQLEFSEYVDRSTARSALSLNPRPEGELELHWFGRRLRIRPSQALAPGRTWTLELGTGLCDLAGNHLLNPLRVPFSTGERLDTLSLDLRVEESGAEGLTQVWMWPQEEAPQRAFGRAPWRSSPDERGRVRFEGLPAGRWLALAVEDRDRDGWWNPATERAALPSRVLSAPDSLSHWPALLRLTDRLWTDTLSLEGGQFLDREHAEFRGHLEPSALADWPDSLRRAPAADSLRLSLLELRRGDGRSIPLAGLSSREGLWNLFLAEPTDSLEHVLRLKDGTDSLSLRAPGGPLNTTLLDARALAQAWASGRLLLVCTQAVEWQEGLVRQVWEGDTLSVPMLRRAVDRLELAPRRPGGLLLFQKGWLRHGTLQWPDTLHSLMVPAATAEPPRGGLQWRWDRSPREVGWRLVIRAADGEHQVTAGLEQVLDRLPVGISTFALYQDRDGSGDWSPGRVSPPLPAEPWTALPDTVHILPGWIQGGLTFQLPEWIP